MKEEKNISEDLVNIQSAEINGQHENNNIDNESEEKAKTENRARIFQNLILTNNKFKEVMLMLNDEKKEKENFGVKDNNDNNKKKALTIDAQIENLKKTKFSFISSKENEKMKNNNSIKGKIAVLYKEINILNMMNNQYSKSNKAKTPKRFFQNNQEKTKKLFQPVITQSKINMMRNGSKSRINYTTNKNNLFNNKKNTFFKNSKDNYDIDLKPSRHHIKSWINQEKKALRNNYYQDKKNEIQNLISFTKTFDSFKALSPSKPNQQMKGYSIYSNEFYSTELDKFSSKLLQGCNTSKSSNFIKNKKYYSLFK